MGWVFGGAVKQEDEEKGNVPISDTDFTFPYFGKYNMENWKNLGSRDESGGDAAITTTTYQKGLRLLEISIVEVGDYGYIRSYKLMDDSRKLLRERTLNFTADMEFQELTETIKNYTTDPKKVYTRMQKIHKPLALLNNKPLMVNGSWTIEELSEN